MKVAILHTALDKFGNAEKLCIFHVMHMGKVGFDVDLLYYGDIPGTRWKC